MGAGKRRDERQAFLGVKRPVGRQPEVDVRNGTRALDLEHLEGFGETDARGNGCVDSGERGKRGCWRREQVKSAGDAVGYGSRCVEERAVKVEDNEFWGEHFVGAECLLFRRLLKFGGLVMDGESGFAMSGPGTGKGFTDVDSLVVTVQDTDIISEALVVKIKFTMFSENICWRKFTTLGGQMIEVNLM